MMKYTIDDLKVGNIVVAYNSHLNRTRCLVILKIDARTIWLSGNFILQDAWADKKMCHYEISSFLAWQGDCLTDGFTVIKAII